MLSCLSSVSDVENDGSNKKSFKIDLLVCGVTLDNTPRFERGDGIVYVGSSPTRPTNFNENVV